MKKILIALTFILTVPNMANAETFISALKSAYSSNPTLLAKRANLKYIEENIDIARSGYRPDIYATASISREDDDRVIGDVNTINSSETPYGVGAHLTQPLFRGFRTNNQVEAAKYNVIAEKNDLLATEQSILLSSATSYIDVLRDELIFDLRVNNENVLKENLEAAKIRFKAGEITKTDVSQSESRLARATSQRISAEGDLESSKAFFENMIGHLPKDLGLPIKVENKMPTSLEEAIDTAIAQNFTISYYQNLVKAAKRDTAAIKGELLPSIDLKADATRDWDSVHEDDRYRRYSLTAEMTIPLYKSGSVRARARQAKYASLQRQDLLNQAKRQARADVTSAWQKWQANKAKIKSTKSQIDATKLALEGVTIESKAGSRTVLDVLDAEQELLDAKVSMAIAMRDEYLSALNLLSAIGEFTANKFEIN